MQFDSGETYDVPADKLTAEAPRDPRTHSLSGMFCPACDARIGVASKCETCGASVSNGWTGQNDNAYPEARASEDVPTVRVKLITRQVENLTRPVKFESAARKLAEAEGLEYRRGYWIVPEGARFGFSPGPVAVRLASLADRYNRAGLIEEAGRGKWRVNLRAVSADLGRRLWADNPAGVAAAMRAVYGHSCNVPPLHPFEEMADALTAQRARVSARLLQTVGHGKRDELLAATVRFSIEAEALRKSGDIGRMAEASSPALGVVMIGHPSPITREAAAREIAGRGAWDAYGDAEGAAQNRKRQALELLGMGEEATDKVAAAQAHSDGLSWPGQDDPEAEDTCPVVTPEDIAAAHAAGYSVARTFEAGEDGRLWQVVSAATGQPIPEDDSSIIGGVGGWIEREGAEWEAVALARFARYAAGFELGRDCLTPGDSGEGRRRARAARSSVDRAYFLGTARGARTLAESSEAVSGDPVASEDAYAEGPADFTCGGVVAPAESAQVGALRAGARALEAAGGSIHAAELRRMADKLAGIEARPISGGCPAPGETPPDWQAIREDVTAATRPGENSPAITPTAEDMDTARREIVAYWQGQPDDWNRAARLDCEEALRRAGDIARDLPEADRVRWLVSLPASILEPLADFGPFEIEDATREALAHVAALAEIAGRASDVREIEEGPAGGDKWEALTRHGDSLGRRLAEIPQATLEDVPTATLEIVSRYAEARPDSPPVHVRVRREIEARYVAECPAWPVTAEQLDPREVGGSFEGWTWRDPMSAERFGLLGLARLSPDAANALRTLAAAVYVESWAVNRRTATRAELHGGTVGEFENVGCDVQPVGGGPIVCAWIDPTGAVRLSMG